MLNLPLATDVTGLRLVAGYERVGGFIDSAATGREDINGADIYTVRGTLLLRPTDRLSLSVTGLYQDASQDNQDFALNRTTAAVVPTPLSNTTTLFQGKLSYDMDFAELSFSASHIDRDTSSTSDVSPSFVPFIALPPPFGLGLLLDSVALVGTARYDVFNGEARLASSGEGPFGWQVGATYRNLRSDNVSGTRTMPDVLPFILSEASISERNKSYSVYGELNYAVTPQLTAIVGVRYPNERKRRVATSANFGFGTTDIGSDTFDTVNPRFNLSYAITPDSMIFANVAKGFRSGGFNLTSAGGGVIAIDPSYDPDSIWTYELGTKHQLFDNRLILDASVYRSEWSGVQSLSFAPGSTIAIITNSGHVSGWGVDLSAIARPVAALTLTGTIGWNNLEFDRATLDKQAGDPVDGAVRQSWSASIDYRPRLSGKLTGIFRIDYQHAGRGQITVRNFAPPLLVRRPAHDLVNLRIGVGVGPVELTLFADNLFDDDTPSIVGPFGTIAENLEQRPRVIGISGRATF